MYKGERNGQALNRILSQLDPKEKRWVTWKDEENTKPPYRNNRKTDVQNNATGHLTYETACEQCQKYNHTGVGLVMGEGLFCIDLDSCVYPESGWIAGWANESLRKCPGAYCEVSPSGFGLKIIGFGTPPIKAKCISEEQPEQTNPDKKAQFEIMSRGYTTITGDVYRGQETLLNLQSQVNALCDQLQSDEPKPSGQESSQKDLDAAWKSMLRVKNEDKGDGSRRLVQVVGRCKRWGANVVETLALVQRLHGTRGYEFPDSPSHEKVAKEYENSYAILGSAFDKNKRTFHGQPVGEFEDVNEDVPWLVESLFASDELLLIGGPKKACKSKSVVELCAALATGTPWMNHFRVPEAKRVLYIAGEANSRRIKHDFSLACAARGVTLADISDFLRVEFVDFPLLTNASDMEGLIESVIKTESDVVILEPMMRGIAGMNTASVADIADPIRRLCVNLLPCSLIMGHHTRKHTERGEPIDLDDLSGSGFAEVAGQWWLMNRVDGYQHDGIHNLVVHGGGRDAFGGEYFIQFDETFWTWEIEPWEQHQDRVEVEAREVQAEEAARNEAQDEESVLLVIAEHSPDGINGRRIRDVTPAGLGEIGVRRALHRLMQKNCIETFEYRNGVRYRVSANDLL